MYLTEKEILDTPNALQRTCTYFDEKDADIKRFFSEHPRRKFVFFGCGSSYMLAKSAATIFSNLLGTEAYAIPAGDYIFAMPISFSTSLILALRVHSRCVISFRKNIRNGACNQTHSR